MEYRWDDFSLDREGALLMRQGRQVNVSRKVLDCIAYLVRHRDRVVGYDELIRAIWGHDNVTNHQLAQMVLASRRTLGDDGHTQRLIRTMPGLGYRWVGTLHEGAAPTVPLRAPALDTTDIVRQPDAPIPIALSDEGPSRSSMDAAPGADDLRQETVLKTTDTVVAFDPPAPDTLARTEVDALASATFGKTRLRVWAASALVLVAVIASAGRFQDNAPDAPVPPRAANSEHAANAASGANEATTIALIQEKYWKGDVEAVREGLATLPPELADSPDAHALEIQLDIDRGRFERATQKLSLQQTKSQAAGDVVLQAKWLSMLSDLNARAGMPAPDVFAPGQKAVALLESIGIKAPPSALGEALSARGTGHLFAAEFELAVRDLVRARDLLLKDGDKRRATTARRMLAHTWFRMGNLTDALDELNRTAKDAETLQDAYGEAAARLVATRLQIELLRWDDALDNSRRNMLITKSVLDSPNRAAATRQYALVLTNFGRLREARSLLEETSRQANGPTPSAVFAMYHLASGKAQSALDDAAAMFAAMDPSSNPNMMLMSQEGALLLWTTAAQELAAQGNAKPAPSAAQVDVLQRPRSTPGRIARGRWLWSKEMRDDAETELRSAFDEARRQGRLFHMTLAAEPLVDLLLENKDIDAADAVLASLRGTNPDRMDRDYRVNLLRLRTALAKGDVAEIEDAHRKALAVAGERSVPGRSRSSSITMFQPRAHSGKGLQ